MMRWGSTSNWLRVSIAATGPLCRCGSRFIEQDFRFRFRCERGHFAAPGRYFRIIERKG